ncbi:YeeE/YedE family protein [Sneathiella sp.]|uniref:YeeE/YedE family protein n=1 Tax=Sneathiella sp. TaxID=1964365 RepID=UPI0039E48C7B
MDIPISTLMAIAGFLIGGIAGYTARMNQFCTFGAIEDARLSGEWRRMRLWVFTIAIAIIGTTLLFYFQLIDLKQSMHWRADLIWVSLIVGGLCFGFGMAQVGTCPYGALVRLGTGDLRSLVTLLVIGVTGYMTMRGLMAGARVAIENVGLQSDAAGSLSIPALLGFNSMVSYLVIGLLIAGGLLVWCFKGVDFRRSVKSQMAGLVIGLCVVSGWFVTGNIGQDEFDPQRLVSLSFISATADGLMYLMTFSGSTINFAIGSVGGVVLGSLIGSMQRRQFKLEAFDDSREMRRHLIGGALMGIGGIMAMGCTVGQGISGVSTLSLGSLIAFASIFVGAVLGLHYLLEDNLKDTMSAFFRSY